jgi:hypothetical protein
MERHGVTLRGKLSSRKLEGALLALVHALAACHLNYKHVLVAHHCAHPDYTSQPLRPANRSLPPPTSRHQVRIANWSDGRDSRLQRTHVNWCRSVSRRRRWTGRREETDNGSWIEEAFSHGTCSVIVQSPGLRKFVGEITLACFCLHSCDEALLNLSALLMFRLA